MSTDDEGWVVVRRWRKSGQRWWLAKAGQFCTRDPKKVLVYASHGLAEQVAEQERRDAAWRGNAYDVLVERPPEPGKGKA